MYIVQISLRSSNVHISTCTTCLCIWILNYYPSCAPASRTHIREQTRIHTQTFTYCNPPSLLPSSSVHVNSHRFPSPTARIARSDPRAPPQAPLPRSHPGLPDGAARPAGPGLARVAAPSRHRAAHRGQRGPTPMRVAMIRQSSGAARILIENNIRLRPPWPH